MSICCRAKFAIDRGGVVRSSILPCKCGIARRVHGADLDLVNSSQTIRAQETMSSRSFSFMCLLPRMCLLPGKLEVEGEGYWIKPSGPRRS